MESIYPNSGYRGEGRRLLAIDLQHLTATFYPDEIKKVIFYMAPFKELGVEGLHAGFYQHD